MKETSAGDLKPYLRDIGRYPLIPHAEMLKLFREMRDTDSDSRREQIKQLLVKSNLRLVVSIAKQYRGQGVEMIDLIQEGNVGLMIAIDRFDPERGVRLSTYATHWIKQGIRRHLTGTENLAGSRLVRLPSHVVAALPKIRGERRRLLRELGSEPAVSLIAENLEQTVDSVQAALDASGPVYSIDVLPEEQTGGGARRASRSQLERYMHESTNHEAINADLEHLMLSNQLRDLVRTAFKRLTPREEQVLRLRFGVMEDIDSDEYQVSGAELAALDNRAK